MVKPRLAICDQDFVDCKDSRNKWVAIIKFDFITLPLLIYYIIFAYILYIIYKLLSLLSLGKPVWYGRASADESDFELKLNWINIDIDIDIDIGTERYWSQTISKSDLVQYSHSLWMFFVDFCSTSSSHQWSPLPITHSHHHHPNNNNMPIAHIPCVFDVSTVIITKPEK